MLCKFHLLLKPYPTGVLTLHMIVTVCGCRTSPLGSAGLQIQLSKLNVVDTSASKASGQINSADATV
jgi:hypothetical protein